jgi:hypothetical protein
VAAAAAASAADAATTTTVADEIKFNLFVILAINDAQLRINFSHIHVKILLYILLHLPAVGENLYQKLRHCQAYMLELIFFHLQPN